MQTIQPHINALPLAPPLCHEPQTPAPRGGAGTLKSPDLPPFFLATLTPPRQLRWAALSPGRPRGQPEAHTGRRRSRGSRFPALCPRARGAAPLGGILTWFYVFFRQKGTCFQEPKCCHPGGRTSHWTPGAALQERPWRRCRGPPGSANTALRKAADPRGVFLDTQRRGKHARSCSLPL